MANQVSARLKGDDYQHLYTWQFVLELKMPDKKVRSVTIEDALAGSVDDVTVQYEPGTNRPDCFYQVKYHVDLRDEYSTEKLIEHKEGKTSLLEKFWRTWNLLRKQNPERDIELYLVSNWTWDGKDGLGAYIDAENYSIKAEAFFSATSTSAIGKLRDRWQKELGASEKDFKTFISCLRFKLGWDCRKDLEERIAERMGYMHLKSDQTALLITVGIVRDWIKRGQQKISLEDLELTLQNHDLYLPEDQERYVTVYLTTITDQKFEIEPDYNIDWRDYFLGDAHKRGHQLKDPSAWNNKLLPELQALQARVNIETDCRFVRARGKARLSPWFAFGFAFSEVAGYVLEVAQPPDHFWRTETKPNTNFHLTITSAASSPDGEALDDTGSTVALGISITDSLDRDVRTYLADRTDEVAALLLLRPDRELGQYCLRDGGDVVALADSVKTYARRFVKAWRAKRLLLFYLGPVSGACFLGHRLNAVCEEIQIMEYQQPDYFPSFLLKY